MAMALRRQFARAFGDIGHVIAYRHNTVQLSGLESARVGSIVDINGQYQAQVCALFKHHIAAIVRSSAPVIEIGQESRLLEEKRAKTERPSMKHQTCSEVLATGYWQIDILSPILRGQFALFSGKYGAGKSALALSAARQLLGTDPTSKVVVIKSGSGASGSHPIPEYEDRVQWVAPQGAGDKILDTYDVLNNLPKDSNVLVIIDDLLDLLNNERDVFKHVHPGYRLYNLPGLLFDLSQVRTNGTSVSTIGVIDFDQDFDRDPLRELDSLASKRYQFGSDKPTFKRSKPQFDFTRVLDYSWCGIAPEVIGLRQQAINVFRRLDELKTQREEMTKLNLHIDPWEEYLLLDSNHFLRLMCQDTAISAMHQRLFLRLCLHIISDELSSRIQLDMETFRKIYLNYITTAPEDSPKIVSAFLDRVQQEDLLSDFADDYMDTVKRSTSQTGSAETQTLNKPGEDEGPKPREYFKEGMASVGLYNEPENDE